MKEYIEAYLSGTLPPETAASFERQMEEDPGLASLVRWHRLRQSPLSEWMEGYWEMGVNLAEWNGFGPVDRLWIFGLMATTTIAGTMGATPVSKHPNEGPSEKARLRQKKSDPESSGTQARAEADDQPGPGNT